MCLFVDVLYWCGFILRWFLYQTHNLTRYLYFYWRMIVGFHCLHGSWGVLSSKGNDWLDISQQKLFISSTICGCGLTGGNLFLLLLLFFSSTSLNRCSSPETLFVFVSPSLETSNQIPKWSEQTIVSWNEYILIFSERETNTERKWFCVSVAVVGCSPGQVTGFTSPGALRLHSCLDFLPEILSSRMNTTHDP